MMGFFKRSNISDSSLLSQRPSAHGKPASNPSDYTSRSTPPPIFKLPSEIIYHILSFLDAHGLVALRRTCHHLKDQAEIETLWIDLIRPNVPKRDFPKNPHPALSYRDLYLNHYPHWHLPRHKIWFSDEAFNGKLILVKFDPLRGRIEGYRLAAEKPPTIAQSWAVKPSVIIRLIEPRVYASTEDPVLNIPLAISLESGSNSSRRIANGTNHPSIYSDVRMYVGRPEHRINASLMLSRDLPLETANARNVSVWPPRTVPSMPRTRSSNSSGDNFTSTGHKPRTFNEISQTTFRLRTWTQFTQGMLSFGVRIGEEVSTWSTLSPDLYTPTPQKPYQGIFVGDYANHGCEFLLVRHSPQAPPIRPPSIEAADGDGGDDDGAGARHRHFVAGVLAALREQQFIDEEDEASLTETAAKMHSAATHGQGSQTNVTPNVPDPDGSIHTGALEAVKLTGDVNVPRGEHTFIADDIGPEGTVRIAWEPPFKGARVVRSRGHVAARGFRDDEFIPSQLFLINTDLLAQYWMPFGHISFYKRVDIDEVLAGAERERRASN